MLFVLLCIVELFLLFLLSQTLTRTLSLGLLQLTRSHKVTVYLLALLFLPGTVIHELAHFSMAKILFVYAGKIRLLPEVSGETVKLGSVQIGKTDPIRRFLIGAAPFICGTISIVLVLMLSVHYNLLENFWILLLLGYTIFEIGNTMFSSKKDMEGAVELLFSLIIIGITLTLLHIDFQTPLITALQMSTLQPVLQTITILLGIPILVDIVVIAIIKGLFQLFH